VAEKAFSSPEYNANNGFIFCLSSPKKHHVATGTRWFFFLADV